MKHLNQGLFTGERALFAQKNLKITDSIFEAGESPLKESRDISLCGCIFKWKYPLWYSKNIEIENTTLLETARSGIWYTEDVKVKNCVIDAPKTFRRAKNIEICDTVFSDAKETLWYCSNVYAEGCHFTGDYLALSCDGFTAKNISVSGNYLFDGAKNIKVENSKLISKDCFWNCENVTVKDSLIIGEYIGWNSKNLTFVNCTIESNQGLCYIAGLKMVNCKLINTDLSFEYSTEIDAEICSEIDSVKNPSSGKIKAKSIKTLIHDKNFVDTEKTVIEAKIYESGDASDEV